MQRFLSLKNELTFKFYDTPIYLLLLHSVSRFFFSFLFPVFFVTIHRRAELDAAGFIRAEENDKRTHIKKIAENFTFL